MSKLALAALLAAACSLFAQDLRLREFQGPERSLEEYRGKVVVLNFWATWCEPCRDEMPLFVAAHQRFAERGVVIIGASADEPSTQRQIPGFLRKLKIDFPIWTAATTEHMKALGLGEGLPATAFFDRSGQIVSRILGPLTREELDRRIAYLLGDSTAVPEALVNHLEHEHNPGDNHTHGSVGLEGASSVPS